MDPLATLQRLANGRLIDELCEALRVTAEEVVTTGKPGTVTVTLKVSKAPTDLMVIVEETIARSAPKKDPRGAFFFAFEGDLFHADPRQAELDFRTVDTTTGEVIEVPASQRVIKEA